MTTSFESMPKRASVFCLSLFAGLSLAATACGTLPSNPDMQANERAVPTEAAQAGSQPIARSDEPAVDHGAMDHGAMGRGEAEESPEPKSAAVRFAEEVFGTNTGDYGIAFAPDGNTIFFTRAQPGENNETIYLTRLVSGHWSDPEPAPFSGQFHDKEPFVSPDGDRVYFSSRRPVHGFVPKQDFDIWYVERRGGGWDDPIHVTVVSSAYNDDYPAVASDGTLMFARNDDSNNVNLWIAPASPRGLGEPHDLGWPINTVFAEADPWIAPNGSLIIFTSPRSSPEAQGQGDLYVIHRQGNGWTKPASLGLQVNTVAHEYGPVLSADRTTFYFSRGFGGQLWAIPSSALDNIDGPGLP